MKGKMLGYIETKLEKVEIKGMQCKKYPLWYNNCCIPPGQICVLRSWM